MSIKSLIASAIFVCLIASAAKAQSKSDFDDLTCSPNLASVKSVAQAPSEQNTSAGTAAESSRGDKEGLEKAAQNPIASMVSIPIQWNATLDTQWAPNSPAPVADSNRTLNVFNGFITSE